MCKPPVLPDATTVVRARRALVVAPHYDDEVLGCGGLLCHLRDTGAEIHLIFLSDGSGGDETVDDRVAYAERRRREAGDVAERLGVASTRHLGHTDGRLMDRIGGIAAALGEAIETLRPDLLLAPSPREVSADHRAAFHALHAVLWPTRDGEPLHDAASAARVLLYEINRPLDPDLLVDVGDRLGEIERLMGSYASQLERHEYLEAAIGLRRYRTLSLPAGARGAEAYRTLELEDFTTRSRDELIRHLGGTTDSGHVGGGPLVSVVVRTRNRPATLPEALASIAAGTYRKVEVVVVNDGGVAPDLPRDYPFPVRRRDLRTNVGPAGAAQAGLDAATGRYVCFLDDDDLFYPEHLSHLVSGARATGCPVVYADAAVVAYERAGHESWRAGARRLPYSRDFEPSLLLLSNYIPFPTVLVESRLAKSIGPFDTELGFFEDWDFLVRLSAHTHFEHIRGVTCEYRHFRGAEHILGFAPGERRDMRAGRERIYRKHRERLAPEVLASALTLLSDEAAGRTEDNRILRKELRRTRHGGPSD